MKTDRLFYENVYLKEFNGKVLSCVEQEGTFRVILDQTAFYPEGGGQPAEGGQLDDIEVFDVQEIDGEIVHFLKAPLEPGTTVHGVIDWERRFQLMQQHSGEHIVSGLIHKKFGYDNVGFHMGSDFMTIDLNGMITPEELVEIEKEANAYIYSNAKVHVFYPNEEEKKALPYRSKKELTGQVRLVEFPGADLCACCGLHVTYTGEIGLIKLISVKKFREGVRIEMLCGKDAFDYLNVHFQQNSQIAVALSVKPEETFEAVKRQGKEAFDRKNEVNALKQASYQCTAKICSGKGNVMIFEENLDAQDIRKCADTILDSCGGICALFSGDDQNGYKYALGERNGNVRELVKEMNEALQGRGGGKPFFAQGSLKGSKKEVISFFAEKEFTLI
ncbi:MAG: alanine--tRNA ligase-related protein [Eubacteriales bacterium]|nr:alanine--tRNA ligase-related protein [Eubacteriales bacterium]